MKINTNLAKKTNASNAICITYFSFAVIKHCDKGSLEMKGHICGLWSEGKRDDGVEVAGGRRLEQQLRATNRKQRKHIGNGQRFLKPPICLQWHTSFSKAIPINPSKNDHQLSTKYSIFQDL